MTTHVEENDFEVGSPAPAATKPKAKAPATKAAPAPAPAAPVAQPQPEHVTRVCQSRVCVLRGAKAQGAAFLAAFAKWEAWSQALQAPADVRAIEAKLAELEVEISSRNASASALAEYLGQVQLLHQLQSDPSQFARVRATLERATGGRFEADVAPSLKAYAIALGAALDRSLNEARAKEAEFLGELSSGDGPLVARIKNDCRDIADFSANPQPQVAVQLANQ